MAQGEGIGERLHRKYGEDVVVRVGMRYGNPSIRSQLQAFEDAGIRKLLVLPLYPQYSGSTNASTFDALARDFMQRRLLPGPAIHQPLPGLSALYPGHGGSHSRLPGSARQRRQTGIQLPRRTPNVSCSRATPISTNAIKPRSGWPQPWG